MNRHFHWSSLLMVGGLMLTAAANQANADAWNKKTYVTTSQSIEVPGAVLPPGKYVFKLVESSSNRHIVQIMNADENHVFATNLAIAKQREQPADKTILTFYEMPGGGPEPIRAWFYPGDTIGQEFLYPRSRANEIARAVKQDVPVLAESRPAQVTTVPSETATPTPTPEPESAVAANTAPVNSEPTPAVEPTPATPAEEVVAPSPYVEPDQAQEPAAPAPATTPAEPQMPHTAGNLFELGVFGIGCLGAAVSMRIAKRSKQ